LEPFFGFLLLKLKFHEDKKGVVTKTMAVDGINLWYHPPFVRTLSEAHLLGVLVHEVLHCVLKHPFRGVGHNAEISGLAADFVTNGYIHKYTNFELPEPHLHSLEFDEMQYEEVYDILMQKTKGKSDDDTRKKQQNCGDFLPAPPDAVDEATGLKPEDYWASAVTEVAALMKSLGNKPKPGEDYLVKQVQPAQLSWEKLLLRFANSNIKTELDWSRFNRRAIIRGIRMPAKNKSGMRRFVAAVDTSASVFYDPKQFEHMLGEMEKICKSVNPQEFILIHCDDFVRKAETFRDRDYPFKSTMAGGNCTAFAPVFKYVQENRLNPNCLVYFTDCEGSFSFPKPSYPVLWINTSPRNRIIAPFGKTIKLKV
jgi:predicted metal-dependent peptidase